MGIRLKRNRTDYVVREAQVETVDKDDGLVTFVMSSDRVDRYGDVVKQDDWQLDNFRANPVLLWAHDALLPPIGRVENVRVEGNKLKGDVRFTPPDMGHPLGVGFGDTIGRMYREGYMSAVSVGFASDEYEERDGDGVEFVTNELLELSAVPIPANADALIEAHKSGIDVSGLGRYYRQLLVHDDDERVQRAYDVIDKIEKQEKEERQMEELKEMVAALEKKLELLTESVETITKSMAEPPVGPEPAPEPEPLVELDEEEKKALADVVKTLAKQCALEAIQQHKGVQ